MGILTELNLFFQAKYILEKVLASSFFIWKCKLTFDVTILLIHDGKQKYSSVEKNYLGTKS